MQIIEENPFRVLGIVSNATPNELKESEVLIKRHLDIGQNAKLKFDISPPMKPINRTNELVAYKTSGIKSPQEKALHAIFWFAKGNSIDNIALQKLKDSKDVDMALADFEKGCYDFKVAENNYTSIINHSTLDLIAFEQHKSEDRVTKALASELGNSKIELQRLKEIESIAKEKGLIDENDES